MQKRRMLAHARPSKIKLVVADALWIASFMLTWCALLGLWNTGWTLILIPLFACHLAGLTEFVHQSVHGNLFMRKRRWNRLMGKIAGGMVGVDFDTYRSFHLEHHRFTNTPKDPERHFYMDATYLELIAPWQGLTISRKITQIFRVVRHLAGALTALGGKSAFVKAVGWFIPLAILGTGYLQGLSLFAVLARVVVAWYLPLFMLLFVEIAVSQSEHYGTEAVEGSSGHGAVPNEVQYGVSWNLHVPAIVRFLLLARNLHAEHHLVPAIHWSQARDQDCGRTLRARDYLHMLWMRGPRA